MPVQDIIGIGASAGGLRPLMDIISALPADFPATLFVVMHLAPRSESKLVAVLENVSDLPVKWAEDQERVERGVVYVAPVNHHLILNEGHVRVLVGARESGSRPSIDVLFRSAAVAYRSRVVGVILSGTLDDGARGLRLIKRCGGTAIVLDPELAQEPEMPRNALRESEADHCLPPREIGPLLRELAGRQVGSVPAVPEEIAVENRAAQNAMGGRYTDGAGEVSGLGCPECGGQLQRFEHGPDAQYRCRVGHAYSSRLLLQRQGEQLEQAIWTALRVIGDRQRVLERLAEDYGGRQRPQTAMSMQERAGELAGQAAILRKALSELCRPDLSGDGSDRSAAGADP